jgi:transposase-like protein
MSETLSFILRRRRKKMSPRKHSSGFKAQVALESIRGDKTVVEIAKKHNVHPNQIHNWKAEVLSKLESLYGVTRHYTSTISENWVFRNLL